MAPKTGILAEVWTVFLVLLLSMLFKPVSVSPARILRGWGTVSPVSPARSPVPTPSTGSDHLPVLDESGRVAMRPEKWSLESSPFPNWASIAILGKEGSGQGFLSYLLARHSRILCSLEGLAWVARVRKA